MDALLFHNPNAGSGDHSRKDMLAALSRAGFRATYCSTKGPDFKDMLKESADLVVVAGGDGTVRKVMTRIADRSIPMAIVPLGTANNVATSLGIVGDAWKHAEGWKAGRRQRFDIGLATGPWGERPFVEAVGCGIFAKAIGTKVDEDATREQKIQLGRDALLDILKKAPPLDVDIDIDGVRVEGDLLAVEGLNIGFIGSKLPFYPKANSGDRVFDVVCLRKDQRSAMLDWLTAPDGTVSPATAVHGRRLRIEYEGDTPLRIDDKLPDRPEKRAELFVEVHGKPIEILLPVEPPHAPDENETDQEQV
ncbi:diacylglycerol/lipid kinase family protein [Allomesorhizobium alhagi]|jgi:diacylglycerol kinase family enzyme|uniref:Putative diacylglycerol kinase n=1 Tax=Mesorhizobium alhagi CCNWXJ12-2 TaxID=1107882 RepID=H0HSQ2_9HYPH|nr:diacylglycerol kinase family protein [Mesorhizobium alhagi]EHK56240.1 putative diacylglycerol kinase [Mesorhizobium alhagi CCNWXJ12-2]